MKIALAGNPNSGKTTLYNVLTGKNERVANWAGVTLDIRQAPLKEIFGNDIMVVDLPGAYSIKPYTSEESITSDFIKNENPDVIINVVDSTNINRALFFSTQLLELGIPVVIALNKSDIASSKTNINFEALEQELKCPVVSVVALKDKGIKELVKKAIEVAKKNEQVNPFPYLLAITNTEEQDKHRHEIINNIAKKVEKRKVKLDDTTLEDKLDKYLTNPFIGIILFIAIMALIFQLSINTVGQYIADFLVGLIENFQVFVADALTNAGVHDFLNALLTDGLIGGVGAVVGFIPLIMVLMFCLVLLEDSGFLARLATIFDPLFKKIGLSGKSIIPMIVGYGCAIPGVMSTRTIKDVKQKRMTALLTPFVPCGAKVPIIALFVTAFFPNSFLFPIIYLIAFVIIILVGLFLKKVTGADVSKNYFIIELPEYKLPSLKFALKKMLDTGKEFAIRAGTIIIVCNTVIFLMSSFNFKFQLVGDAVDTSILAHVATPLSYLLIPLGIGIWQLTAAAITGFIAKEEVVGTLAVVYSLSNAINEDFELTNAVLVQETLGISAIAALAFMFFNLFTPPCLAALGAMRTELKSRHWFFFGILTQLGTGYLVAMLTYQIGSLIVYGKLGEGFVAAVIILVLVILGFIIYTVKLKKQPKLELSYKNK